MTPAITVIIPTYNRADLLTRAIQSVVEQTFENWELVIADDCSSDRTAHIVAAIADRRICYVRRDQNGGNAAARNTGLSAARAPLVSFLDSDDEYLPNFLTEAVRAMECASPVVGFAWTGIERVFYTADGEQSTAEEIWDPPQADSVYLLFLRELRIGTNHGLTVRRECFDMVGVFDERIRALVDKEFLIRLGSRFKFQVIPKVLVRHHEHPGARVSDDIFHKALADSIVVEKHHEALRQDRALWLLWHYRTGLRYYQCGDKRSGRRYILTGLSRWPFAVTPWAHMVLFEMLSARSRMQWRDKLRRWTKQWRNYS